MNTDLRPGPGPRDWLPPGSMSRPLFATHTDNSPSQFYDLRGIGLLSVVLGAPALAMGIGTVLTGRLVDLLPYGVGAAALAIGIVGLVVLERLGPVNRVASVIGVSFATLALSLTGLGATGLLSTSTPPPAASQTAAPAPTPPPVSAQDERRVLVQSAATVAYLIHQSYGDTGPFPAELVHADGLITTTAGVWQLPTGARFSYKSDGSTFSLVFTGFTMVSTYTHGGSVEIHELSD